MAKQMSALQKVKQALETHGYADSIGRTKSGTVVARRGFFYTHGNTADKYREAVEAALKKAGLKYQIVDAYEQWRPFRGGASIAASSHWGVEIKILEDESVA